jgi:N-acetylglucosaminyldiphosphoundecaprenol N-acetyl-beta-D-mannosaminyltransferase
LVERMSAAPRKIPILGTPVAVVDYQSAIKESRRLAAEPRPSAVAASNTHIIALARQRPDFGRVMRTFDLVLPDGMPLRWSLNAQGAGLADRVYGPYFVEKMVRATPRPWRHFFFGGTEETLEGLVAHLRQVQPDLEVAGTLSPPFRAWTEEDEGEFSRIIAGSKADFVWVALGGERQERWIVDNLRRHQRGVFFAVGDAFALLAGERAFAPAWIQRAGLTWVYRLWQEPRRLWRRYTRFNSLFLYYSVRDALLGTPRHGLRTGEPPSIAFLGSRGVPARYSGFEVVVEELGKRLAARGHDVTVYNRLPHFGPPRPVWEGMKIIGLPTVPTKSLDTIVHTMLSMLDAVRRRYDIIYLCGVGNAILGRLARAAGMKVIINVDGADFSRKKWRGFARSWLRRSERWAAAGSADCIIADNATIVDRYEREYGMRPEHLSYGVTVRDEPVHCGELERWGLEPDRYFLYVARLTPENEADLLLEAYRETPDPLPLVLVGGDPYEHGFRRKLEALATDRVIFTGLRFADAYVELSQNARAFIMPATIEATRLVLLDQLGMGKAVIYRDCAATREVLGDAGIPFGPDHPVASLSAKLAWAKDHPEECAAAGRRARRRAEDFRWENVLERYEQIFRRIRTHSAR